MANKMVGENHLKNCSILNHLIDSIVSSISELVDGIILALPSLKSQMPSNASPLPPPVHQVNSQQTLVQSNSLSHHYYPVFSLLDVALPIVLI
jgi:hypothetical protein